MWRDDANVLDMLIWARRAAEYVRKCSEPQFLADSLLQDATIRCVEVIGEAAGRVSDVYRDARPEVSWAEIVGMRNRLAHEYARVNLAEVWRTASEDCPALVVQLEPLVPNSGGIPDEWEFI
jgi:uncharacterized protein with HEPN domain